jgi:hypothetical protein
MKMGPNDLPSMAYFSHYLRFFWMRTCPYWLTRARYECLGNEYFTRIALAPLSSFLSKEIL